jgi:hypothetical protein
MSKRSIIIGLVIVAAAAAALYYQHYLDKAHSTLENYAAFRGCTALARTTDTSAACTLASGEVLTLVEINGKWYLEGDGPGVW